MPNLSTLIPLLNAEIPDLIRRALAEDIGSGDITTAVCVPSGTHARARIFAKESGVLAGVLPSLEVWKQVDPQLEVQVEEEDGADLSPGQTIQTITGNAASILIAERTALNFIQHLSGVATHTRQLVNAVAGTQTEILDTRKTIPGLRLLQKYAVRCGGGVNHRFGLYDRFLLKDNHLALFGRGRTLAEAVQMARRLKPEALVEVEVDREDQIPTALAAEVDIILLDNMSLEELRSCVDFINHRAKTEASGNMTLARVPQVARTGVDYISLGALTHSVRALDFSLEISCD